jgi:hypothetical protein
MSGRARADTPLVMQVAEAFATLGVHLLAQGASNPFGNLATGWRRRRLRSFARMLAAELERCGAVL